MKKYVKHDAKHYKKSAQLSLIYKYKKVENVYYKIKFINNYLTPI